MERTSPAAATRTALDPLARAGMAAALAVTVAGALAAALTGGARPAALAAEAGILAFAALVLIRPAARDLMLLGVSAVLALAVAVRVEAPAAVLERGLGLAAYLATFLLTLGFVRDAAHTSPLVATCGAYMTSQPPGRRYAVLTVGAHLFSIILSFGVLNLLGTMVRRGNTLQGAGGDERVRAIRERRMLSALMRGFGAMLVWSPTTVNQALLLTFVPGLTWPALLPLGLGMAALLMACGWAADRLAWPPAQRRTPGPAPPPGGPRAAAGMLLIVVAVLGLVAAVDALLAPSLIVAVMLVAPAFALAWIGVQNARGGVGTALVRTGRRLERAVADGFPASRSEVLVLAAAGFIGTSVGALVPVAAAAGAIEALDPPAVAVLAAIMLLIPLASQVAINPIVSFTLLGAAIQQGLFADIDGRLVAVAMSAGWALSLNTSPFSASVLIVARLTALPVTRIAHRWHGPYALGAWAAAALYLALLAAWLGQADGPPPPPRAAPPAEAIIP